MYSRIAVAVARAVTKGREVLRRTFSGNTIGLLLQGKYSGPSLIVQGSLTVQGFSTSGHIAHWWTIRRDPLYKGSV